MVTQVLVVLAVIVGVPIAALAALSGVLRVLPARRGPYLLAGVDATHARRIIADAMWASADTRWGFPTGFFEVVDQPEPSVVVAVERAAGKSIAPNLVDAAWRTPMSWATGRDDWYLVFVALLAAAAALPILTVMWAWEAAGRFLLRSTVTAVLTGTDAGTNVMLRGSGLSGRGAVRMLQAALAAPVLPPTIRRALRRVSH